MSVVIPNYPDAVLVEETLRSISETEPIEVIVVDDASPVAGTQSRLRELADEGLITKLILRDANGGAAAAMNVGARSAITPYVYIIANDDLLMPGVLARLADLLDADPGASFACGGYVRFGSQQGTYLPPTWDPWRLLYASRWPGSYMARTADLLEIGGVQTTSLFEDWDTYLAFAEHGKYGIADDEVAYRYRVHGSDRLWSRARREYANQYRLLKNAHRALFEREPELRAASPAPRLEKFFAKPIAAFRVHRPVFVTEIANRAGSTRLGRRSAS